MNSLNQFFFGIYPYIALTVFLLGSLARFEREAIDALQKRWMKIINGAEA